MLLFKIDMPLPKRNSLPAAKAYEDHPTIISSL